jgi:xylulokinase
MTGTPVLTGTTDTAAENLASGVVAPGQGTLKLASVGRVVFITDQPARHPHLLNYPYFEGLWYPGTASKFAASAYRWLRESLWRDVPNNSYETMDAAAAQVPVGAGGLVFLPHLMGQFAPHWNPVLKGAFVGVDIHHDLRHFTRAVLEGVAFSIRDAFEQANELDFNANELYLIGNGARSPLWRQIMADVMGRIVHVPRERDAAYGAVFMAGMGSGTFPRQLADVAQQIQLETTCLPDEHSRQMYDGLFRIYRQANDMMVSLSPQVDHLTESNQSEDN